MNHQDIPDNIKFAFDDYGVIDEDATKTEQIRALVWPDDDDVEKFHVLSGNGIYAANLGDNNILKGLYHCNVCWQIADHPRDMNHSEHCGIGKILDILGVG